MRIDAVITWVDGNDPAHAAKRSTWLRDGASGVPQNAVQAYRWHSEDEIRFCLSSLNHHAPWLERVWIVTDAQQPPLESLPATIRRKIAIVDHAEIFDGIEAALPTFNSISIETVLWRIPGLSEHFVYFNDDIFLTSATKPEHFFAPDGTPVIRGRYRSIDDQERLKLAQLHKMNAAALVDPDVVRYFNTAHVAAPLRRSTFEEFFRDHPSTLHSNVQHRFRDPSQFSVVGLHDNLLVSRGDFRQKKFHDWLVFPAGASTSYSAGKLREQMLRMYDPDIRLVCVNNMHSLIDVLPDFPTHLERATGSRRDFWWYRERLGRRFRSKRPPVESPVGSEHQWRTERRSQTAQAKRYRRDHPVNSHHALEALRKQLVVDQHAGVLNRLRVAASHRPIRVTFIVNQAAKWNCGSIWKELVANDHFDCSIAVTTSPPLAALTPAERAAGYSRELHFFRQIDPGTEAMYDPELDLQRPVDDLNSDIVFLQQPWGMRDYPMRLLGKSLSCYMHYGFMLMANDEMHYNVGSFFPFLWRYFEQTEAHRRLHLAHDPTASHQAFLTGYPKFDDLLSEDGQGVSWPEYSAEKRVIFAPHQSLGPRSLRMSTFRWSADGVLELARRHPEMSWLYKPHPMLRQEVARWGVRTPGEYEAYVQSWEVLPGSMVHDSGAYFGLFREADALITDSGSFLAEFLLTGKPIFWLRSWGSIGFNLIGQELSKAFYQASRIEDLETLFQQVVVEGDDYLADERSQRVELIHPKELREAGSRVVDHICGALWGETASAK